MQGRSEFLELAPARSHRATGRHATGDAAMSASIRTFPADRVRMIEVCVCNADPIPMSPEDQERYLIGRLAEGIAEKLLEHKKVLISRSAGETLAIARLEVIVPQ